MQPQRCLRCRSTWTERKLSPRSRQSSRGSRKVVGDCAGGVHMAAGTVLSAASIYLRFIIQPTTAPDATPRRATQLLLTQVLDCERGRIPFGPDARRYNLMPDLSCVNLDTGEVDYRGSVLPADAVCCMEADQGPFAMYRQPLGNAKEAVTTVNIHNRRFRPASRGRKSLFCPGPADLQTQVQSGRGANVQFV